MFENWKQGNCVGRDPDLWHPNPEDRAAYRAATEAAVKICITCPVVMECRAYAMQNEPYGTWGAWPEDKRELERYRAGQPLLIPVKVREKMPKIRHLRFIKEGAF